jgi:ATP-binding cassette subfamily B protein
MRHALDQHYWRMRTTADERRSWYYDWLLTAAETAAELRLFGLGHKFQHVFQDLRTKLRTERVRLARRQAWAELLAGMFGFGAAGVALSWMAWRALQHQVTLGDLALFYQAFQQGLGLSRSLLDNVGQLYSNTLFLGNLFEFLGLESKVLSVASPRPALRIEQGIRFRGVTFRYPGTERLALRGLDLEIAAKRITAIVGANGAGKSTLLKLLCRFYDPDEGVVELDGADLREVDLDQLRRALTVLFQQPVHYNATASENIMLGDPSVRKDLASVERAAESAGAAEIIGRLPNGYDQLLGRWFENGTELSTGEWQRIALARAFLRQAPILILDEPTSAMDPWAETDWLSRFRRLAVGHTAIVITHRFTTAMIADTIHVLSEGQVLESGSHEQLLRAGGLYSRGWAAQNVSHQL